MSNLNSPLSDDELHKLDKFLLERFAPGTESEDKDEGVIGVSELDGLFTALASGPVLILPANWLPAVWGDYEPQWKDTAETAEIMDLLLRHLRGITDTMAEQLEEFEPLFMESREGEETIIVVDEWCEGYIRGIDLASDEWEVGGVEIDTLLNPIMAFSSATDWQAEKVNKPKQAAKLRDSITPNVREIYALWQENSETTDGE
jgi:uncharacterized protein